MHEIGLDRAKLLFNAAHYFQDAVFARIFNLQTPESFVAAKIKYHSICLRSYELQYTWKQNLDLNISGNSNLNKSIEATNDILDVIKSTNQNCI